VQAASIFTVLILILLAFAPGISGEILAQRSDPYREGIQAFQQGNAAEALQLFQQAAQLRPHDARVANALGNTWLTLNQPGRARQEYMRALTLDPKLAAARKNLGILEYQQDHFSTAQRQLEAATQALPQDAVAWRFLGLSLAGERRPKEARVTFERAIELMPENAEARLDLARVEAQSGEREAALADYRRLVRNVGLDPGGQKSIGLALADLGDHADAISQFQFVLEKRPGDDETSLALAQNYAQAQQPEQAIATVQRSLPNASDKCAFYTLLGWINQQNGHSNEAAEAYRQAILADPKRPEAYLQLSWLYAEYRHFDDGAKTLREGLRFVPDPFSLKLQLATILTLGGHEPEAEPVLQEVIAADPHNPAGYTTLVITYTLLDPSYVRALEIAEKAVKQCPESYLTHYLYAGLLFRMHRQDFAQSTPPALVQRIRSELMDSIRLNPDFPHSSYDLARVDFETGRYPAAEREAQAALRADKEFSEARYLLGRIYIKEGRKEEGQAEMARVEQQHVDDIHQVEAMGQALLAQQAAATGSAARGVAGPAEAVRNK
jgi:tetratricopeptide (TPR) repeat protein